MRGLVSFFPARNRGGSSGGRWRRGRFRHTHQSSVPGVGQYPNPHRARQPGITPGLVDAANKLRQRYAFPLRRLAQRVPERALQRYRGTVTGDGKGMLDWPRRTCRFLRRGCSQSRAISLVRWHSHPQERPPPSGAHRRARAPLFHDRPPRAHAAASFGRVRLCFPPPSARCRPVPWPCVHAASSRFLRSSLSAAKPLILFLRSRRNRGRARTPR